MALRTNAKVVKERIRDYLMDYVTEMMDEREILTDKPFTEYMKIMNYEARFGSNTEQGRFRYWLEGLGGFGADIFYFGGKAEYGYSKCREILADWLEQTPTEVLSYDDRKCETLMVHLCYREMKAMERKEVM